MARGQKRPIKLFVMAVQGMNMRGETQFHADFYFAENVAEVRAATTAAFLKKHPEFDRVATSSYALESGMSMIGLDGKGYQLIIEEVKKKERE